MAGPDELSSNNWITSASLFIAANAAFYCSILWQNNNDASLSSNSDILDGDERNSSSQDSHVFYFQRRLQHRLSFPKFEETTNENDNNEASNRARHERAASFDEEDELQTTNRSNLSTATQYSVGFYPRNSNWKHFENFEQVTTIKKEEARQAKWKKFGRKNSNPLDSASEDEVRKGNMRLTRESKNSSAIYMSLEGERIVKGNSMHRSSQLEDENDPLRSAYSTDDENGAFTDDDDDDDHGDDDGGDDESEESFNLFSFAWSGRRKKSTHSRRRPDRVPLPVIMSERNFETPSDSKPQWLQSQPSSMQSSVTDDPGENDLNEDAKSWGGSPTSTSQVMVASGGKDDSRLTRAHSNVQLPPPPTQTSMPRRSSSAPLIKSDSNLTMSTARVRANYNARIMPNRLILVRHGQSMGNIDETLYSTTADNAIPLTKLGWLQARQAGQRLKDIVKNSNDVHFIVSPYVRTVETFHGIASAWLDPNCEELAHIKDPILRRKAWYTKLADLGLSWAEDPRIREQDFGNLQDPAKIMQYKKERNHFGAFYYRFAHGESAADVFDRISTFLDSLWRSFDVHPARNFVLITHGISIRVLLARYFRYTIDQFHCLSNPRNCEMIVMKHDGRGRLDMAGRHELETLPTPKDDENECSGEDGCDVTLKYKYHKRLRCLPPEFVRKVKVRISYEDGDDDDE